MVSIAATEERASLSTTSDDREGIVAQVSQFLFQKEANLEATYSVEFGGHYGLHFYFRAPQEKLAEIKRECGIALEGLSPVFRRGRECKALPKPERLFEVIVYSYDQKGIVFRVAHELAREHVNILAHSGCSFSAPFAGSQMFVCKLKVALPEKLDEVLLRKELEELADDHGWSLYLEPLAEDMEKVRERLLRSKAAG